MCLLVQMSMCVLAADIVTCTSVTVFKTKLKTLLYHEVFNCYVILAITWKLVLL